MMAMSGRASPGCSAAFQCHCSTRAELTMEPSSSAKQVVGSRKTSVLMLAVSTSLNSPKLRQNSEVSVASGSMMTRNFSLDRPLRTRPVLDSEAMGLKPCAR